MQMYGDQRLAPAGETLRFAGKIDDLRLSHRPTGAVSAQTGSNRCCTFVPDPQVGHFGGSELRGSRRRIGGRDKLAKRRIVLRELKESAFRLRVLRRTGYLSAEHDPVLNETTELIKIVASLIRKSAG
jgi:hypothetical protein